MKQAHGLQAQNKLFLKKIDQTSGSYYEEVFIKSYTKTTLISVLLLFKTFTLQRLET